MRSTRQKSKSQTGSPMDQANPQVQIPVPEEETPQEPGGEGAVVVAVNGAAAAVEITVRIAKARLHCPGCTLPLKPPVFQCAFGHLACGVCRLKHPGNGRCYVCGHDGGYARSTAMEEIVSSAKVLCPHDAYGCRAYVTYYDAAEHQRACPHAPCLCSEPGCGFAGTAAALRDHLAAAHAWPVDGVRYGADLRLRVQHSDPAQHRRLLAAAGDGEGDGDDGGEVFLLAVGAIRDRPFLVASLVCARPAAAAAAGPRYACTIRAVQPSDAAAAAAGEGSAETVVLEMAPVPSSAAPAETSIEEAASLVVLRRTLPGAAAWEMNMTVRIDRIRTWEPGNGSSC